MLRATSSCLAALTIVLWLATPVTAQRVPTPDQFLGFRVGADRQLARWDQIVAYLTAVSQNSSRVRLLTLGKTTQGVRWEF